MEMHGIHGIDRAIDINISIYGTIKDQS